MTSGDDPRSTHRPDSPQAIPPDAPWCVPDAADALAHAAEGARALPCLVGFDGFIDSIIHMVDQRADMTPAGYTRFTRIADFAARCASAAGKSTNIEQVLVERRFGGNGPLMAGALGRLGGRVTFVGAVGASVAGDEPEGDTPEGATTTMSAAPSVPAAATLAVHPVFRPFARRCERVVAVGPPSTTDCLEFDDGKLMFNNTAAVQAVTWERVRRVVGDEVLRGMITSSRLIGVVNWSLLGGVPGLWRGIAGVLRDHARTAPREWRPAPVFVDLSDPAKRTDADVDQCLRDLVALNEHAPVTLGLNLAEGERIARVAGLSVLDGAPPDCPGQRVRAAAELLRATLNLACVVIHPRHGSAAATRERSAWMPGPYTARPRLSTGAGDHFNAGFALARALGLELEHALAAGNGVSGAYVRDAESPTLERLVGFLRAGV